VIALRPAKLLTVFLAALTASAGIHAQNEDVDAWDAPDGRPEVREAESFLDNLAQDSADSAVLFGAPTAEQRDRVARDARAALSASVRAEPLLQQAIVQLQERDDFATDPRLQTLRSELAVEYLEYRLPFARARAALLIAANDPAHARAADLATIAADSVRPLDLRDPVLEARRATILSVSALLGAALGASEVDSESERAFEFVQQIAAPDPRTAVEAVLQHAQRMATTGRLNGARDLLDRASRRPPFRDDTDMAIPVWRALLADAEFRINMDASETLDRRDAEAAVERAYFAYERLLRDIAMPMTHASRRALALQRLARVMPSNAQMSSQPRIVLVALCAADAGETGFDSGAIQILERRLESDTGADPWMRSEFRWELASQLLARADAAPRNADADRRRSMTLLTEIGVRDGNWPDSELAMSTACELAIRFARAGEIAGAAGTLRIAIEQRPDAEDVNRWRLALASITESADEQRGLLESVPEGSPERARACVELMTIAKQTLDQAFGADRATPAESMLRLRADVIRSLDATPLDASVSRVLTIRADVLAIDALLVLDRYSEAVDLAAGIADEPGADRWMAPLAARLHRSMIAAEIAGDDNNRRRWAEQLVVVCQLRDRALAPGDRADRNLTTMAEAHLAAGRVADSMQVADDLIARLGPRTDLLRVAAEARFVLGDDTAAMGLFRQIASPLEARGALTDEYWQAWSRMLEILSRHNESGDRDEAIRLEIARLRMIDSSLGGEPFASRIEAISRSVAAADGD
jgi:tetratricopeptide (TPR) repeat protein